MQDAVQTAIQEGASGNWQMAWALLSSTGLVGCIIWIFKNHYWKSPSFTNRDREDLKAIVEIVDSMVDVERENKEHLRQCIRILEQLTERTWNVLLELKGIAKR